MADNEDKLTIESCPLCGESHVYQLAVMRIPIMGMFGVKTSQKHKRTYTRFFTCPKTDKQFEATFTLVESDQSPIGSVAVTGPTKEADDDA
jgi:hypothetical protein